MSGQSSAPASRRTRAAALVAGGALVVGGVGYTLASWTDTEWVFGGNGTGGPGIGTSTFEVEQNVTAALDSGWTQAEENPGQEMTFGLDGIALSPGDATYAGVRLRTVAGSIAGDVRMAAAETATGVTTSDPGELLWQALQVRVATTADGVPCGATAFTTGTVIADGPLASTGAAASQALAADAGSEQAYCFEVSLPTTPSLPAGVALDALQGRTAAPAWVFAATSR
ncbi:acyl-CoA dehydrogenase [Curtobacterium sp. ODYSSEY 48 V2]|uniref:acyl-CoA dehydrogenase n=1 Tax=Curtobacterium sp. ODYSSEY 48 V2 TaxID=2939561 RepID=UPI00203B78A1|nr:acyl-CoA dehydrogenase [Curtobacterium sp. ODYSSEY 48 V2]MCM3506609.1 acyl-CoA dehydrogenase [Curtobacterium sp. ODYSSEY 48 V2]